MSSVATESKAAAGAVGVVIGASGKEVCRAFRNTGRCRFDKDCKFEHSTGAEITPPPRDYTPSGACHNWTKEQKCRFGDRCRFVHGADDKRTTYRPERKAQPEGAGAGTQTGDKQEICRNFQSRGRCRFGERCRHLHVEGDKKPAKAKEEKKQSAGAGADGDGDGEGGRRRTRPRRRGPRGGGAGGQNGAAAGGGAAPAPKKERSERDSKVLRDEDKFDADGVELCRNFRNTGECRFGDNCTYSHVPGGPIGHPAKRAVAGECYEFKEKGACKFGAECRFKHGDGDGRTEVPRKRSKPAA